MNRRILALSAFVLTACDKGGIYHFGVPTDVIEPCGARSSVYLRSVAEDTASSTPARTEMLILGSVDPLDVVAPPVADEPGRCFLFGHVERSSSTYLRYGTYELDAAGNGVAHVTAIYEFVYEPQLNIGGRMGAQRYDAVFDLPFQMGSSNNGLDLDIESAPRHLESLGTVLDAIDVSTTEGITDVYQMYNISLFFSQVRVPAFGGLGMTRYIGSGASTFKGLISGEFLVGVESLTNPTATIAYREDPLVPGVNFQDFPSIHVFGTQITRVNISGNGDMAGAVGFEFHDPADPSIIRFGGSVDYGMVTIGNGVASGGTYTVSVTTPTVTSAVLPYSLASNVDLSHALPPTP